ncbi:MAG: hypothetical protein ACLSW4_00190 [Clostridia bacterium]|jgi:hypothetical protein|nr:hypothetical protein [Clostridium sp.]MEE0127010.1 hypothetical protein [Clostridia bacterium]HJJ13030.1 hypothetical protein [Clostridiaceae bacterium]
MELNEEIITRLKEEVKAELKDEISETAVGYVHVFNKRLEKKLQENNIEYKEDEEVANKQID